MTAQLDEYDRSMTVVSAHDVARELRLRLPAAGSVKIHKLLYFAQGLHLALTGEPMFRERIEAWAMGPVVADLWHDEGKGRPSGPELPLGAGAISVLDEIVERFRDASGPELVQLTHQDGGPWCQVTETDDARAAQNQLIATDVIRRWFENDKAVVAHRSAARRIGQRRRLLEDLPPKESGLLQAIEVASERGPVYEGRP